MYRERKLGTDDYARDAKRVRDNAIEFLEVDEQRYGSDDIRRLYESAKYPLARRSARS